MKYLVKDKKQKAMFRGRNRFSLLTGWYKFSRLFCGRFGTRIPIFRNLVKCSFQYTILLFPKGVNTAPAILCFLEKAMAPHSSTLASKILWTKEPGRLQSMESLGVGHDWVTSLSLFTFHVFHFSLSCIGEGNGNPLQCSCLEKPRDGGAWWAAVYGVA